MVKVAVLRLIAAFLTLGQIKVDFYDKYYDVELLSEYDFIIIGAGTSGSVVASRVTEDSNTTVLVIEAGRSGREDAVTDIPFYTNKLYGTERDWNYTTIPQEHANNRTLFYSRGRRAGGSSSHNYLSYCRGAKEDFDAWEEVGATGWNFQGVEPFFKKVERASDDDLSDRLGHHGKLKLSRSYSKIFYDFIVETFRGTGMPVVDFLSEGGILSGISKNMITAYKGVRQYAANSYLWSEYEERKSHLHFSFESTAENILLEEITPGAGYQATGVRFRRKGFLQEVRARKEVIVSGGTINSPQILMLSGIGPRQHLESLDIEVKVDLPGVGSNLQDHPVTFNYFYGSKFPKEMTTSVNEALNSFPNYLTGKSSPMTNNPAATSAVCHLHSNLSSIRLPTVPHFQIYFEAISSRSADYWPEVSRKSVKEIKISQDGLISNFFTSISLRRPKSKGSIRLRSNDPSSHPDIDMNILSNPFDVEAMVEGHRLSEGIEGSSTFRKFEIGLVAYPDCKQHKHTLPRSDDYYRCLLRKNVYPFGHACCTNRMGRPTDKMTVLDSRLRVVGVSGLRVVDASVMPFIVSASTQATCYMIGEKAAEMIKEDWRN